MALTRQEIQARYQERHRDEINAKGRAKVAAREAAGLCKECGKVPPRLGFKRCERCNDRSNARGPAYWTKRKAAVKDQYAARKAAGLCTECSGDVPAIPGQTRCEAHRVMQNQRSKTFARVNVESRRAWRLRDRYGITPEQWDAMFADQGRRCAICSTTTPGERGWATDHCHATGKVRGILCQNCNALLGMARDTPLTLERAARYVVIRGGKTNERQAPLLNTEDT